MGIGPSTDVCRECYDKGKRCQNPEEKEDEEVKSEDAENNEEEKKEEEVPAVNPPAETNDEKKDPEAEEKEKDAETEGKDKEPEEEPLEDKGQLVEKKTEPEVEKETHDMAPRYVGDTIVSVCEYSPWVREMRLPLEDGPIVIPEPEEVPSTEEESTANTTTDELTRATEQPPTEDTGAEGRNIREPVTESSTAAGPENPTEPVETTDNDIPPPATNETVDTLEAPTTDDEADSGIGAELRESAELVREDGEAGNNSLQQRYSESHLSLEGTESRPAVVDS